jgi:deoxyribonuclease IV
MLLGVHCSISGGFDNAFLEAERLGINTFQIFTKNQRQWKERIISESESETFRRNLKKYNILKSFSHCTYLVNIASSDEKIRTQSVFSLTAEIQRCEQLGLDYAVLHPGSFKNATLKEGVTFIMDGLKKVLKDTSDSSVKILLENTAGQGSSIGGDFETIAEIISSAESDRIGFCMDTCHAYAAGYDISTADGFNNTIHQIDKIMGLEKLYAFHLNDSKGTLGSHLDRHEHIGKGNIGVEAFHEIIHNFPHIPKVLETPKENDMDRLNLQTLRNLKR